MKIAIIMVFVIVSALFSNQAFAFVDTNNVSLLIKDGVHYCSDLDTELKDYVGLHATLQRTTDGIRQANPGIDPNVLYNDVISRPDGQILESIKTCLKNVHNYDVSQLPIIETPEFGPLVIMIMIISLVASLTVARKLHLKN